MGPLNYLRNAVTTPVNTNYQTATALSAMAHPADPTPRLSPPANPNPLTSPAVLLGTARPTTGNLPFSTDHLEETVKDKLDSLSEMGETESLRLQMSMDRVSKMMQTLSNLLKKMTDTASGLVRNIK